MLSSNIPTSFLHAYADSQYIYHDVSLSPSIGCCGNSFPPQDHHLPSPHHHLFTPSTKKAELILEGVGQSSTTIAPREMPVLSPTHNFFPTNRTCLASMAKKRVSKRDRHSKIFTRQGPRDRRMRLSLEIARKFFDLQDMLGFDKASKTVGWLLNKSKAAIRELCKDLTEGDASSSGGGGAVGDRSASSMSECEVISRGIEETIDNVGLAENGEKSTHKVKKSRLLRKTTFHPLAKESRAMARAKARERTEEKIRNRKLEGCTGKAPSYLNPSRSSSPGKARKESGSLNDNYDNSSLGLVNELGEPIAHPFGHQAAIHSMVDESIPPSGEAVNSIFDYHHQGVNSDNHLVSFQNNDMINFFSDNWEMDGPRMHSNYCVVPNMHSPTNDTHGRVTTALFKASSSSDHGNVQSHFTDVQFCPKSWDAYNNQNLC